jgi:NAD dependent epimerase/dehydratase family enzyme
MPADGGTTAFVTEAAGFIGVKLVRVLTARGHQVPAVVTRLVVGRILADDFVADAQFSNIRLRGTGFRFEYPTVEQGLRQILGALHA